MMLAFPQLASGAMAQLPMERSIRFRSRTNEAADGSVIHIGDPDYVERSWDLTFRDLTDGEWESLETLFTACEGRLGVFTFLEPGSNLLSWSEKLTQSPWVVSGSAADGQPDPFGGSRGSLLSAGSSATQTIAAPATFRYAASAWLRTSGAGSKIRLSDSASQAVEHDVNTSGAWARYVVRYSGSSATDVMSFGLSAGPGASVSVYGPQLEAQLATSAYKISSARGGVFANTRFGQDALADEAQAPSRHDTRVRLIWTSSQP